MNKEWFLHFSMTEKSQNENKNYMKIKFSIYEVLLEQNHSFIYCLWLTCTPIEEFRVVATETLRPTKPKYLLSGLLQKRYADPRLYKDSLDGRGEELEK